MIQKGCVLVYQFLAYMYMKQHSDTWLVSRKIWPHVLRHELSNAVSEWNFCYQYYVSCLSKFD